MQSITLPRRKHFSKIFSRRPILQLEYHGNSIRILQSFANIFETFPELPYWLVMQCFPTYTVDKFSFCVSEIT